MVSIHCTTLSEHVISMRTSYFDIDFASQMKLTKFPLIHCFVKFMLCFLFLQVSFAQQFPAMNTDSDTWTHQRLKFTVTKDIWLEAGPLGGVFSASHHIARRMSRLQLTDVEISLFAAMLLFCSGKVYAELCFHQYTISIEPKR